MIKTDSVIYHTKTQKEYDWLIEKLEENNCTWESPYKADWGNWQEFMSDTGVQVVENVMQQINYRYYLDNMDCMSFGKYEFIEVSDIMEDEDESEILDKLEDLKRIEDEFKNLCEKYDEQYDEQKDKTQKIKKIVFTTEVYFE